MKEQVKQSIFALMSEGDLDTRVRNLNYIKRLLREVSPFAAEPVDCVLWAKNDRVKANSYNPNSVAPPEMELLRTSITQDGYTQPIVAWELDDGVIEVVDGFHRHRVGKECSDVTARIHGYLPVTLINKDREGLGDRMVSTVRHNRARGKHSVDGMSDIVVELKRRNWTDSKITKELGMDVDEVLRLCQISGLTEMFKDVDFSASWVVADRDDGDIDSLAIEEASGEDDE